MFVLLGRFLGWFSRCVVGTLIHTLEDIDDYITKLSRKLKRHTLPYIIANIIKAYGKAYDGNDNYVEVEFVLSVFRYVELINGDNILYIGHSLAYLV